MASNFSYVFVSADNQSPITARQGDKSGGLDGDDLRRSAETHFATQVPANFHETQEQALTAMLQEKSISDPGFVKHSAASMVGAVEIVSLLLPAPDNGFLSVSLYCDQYGQAKGLPINERATSIAKECGHSLQVYGDAFFGRCMDDESKEWERVDFTIEDLSSEAPWVKDAQKRNRGKSLGGMSTSGVFQNMLKSNNTSVIDSNSTQQVATVERGTTSEVSESDCISWTQTKEEMEVRIKLPLATVKSSDIDVKIHTRSVQVVLKSGQPISSESISAVSKIVQKGGSELWASVDPDSSAWTLDKSKQGEVYVVCSLAKNVEAQWPQLTK
jgi:hypothetical protein